MPDRVIDAPIPKDLKFSYDLLKKWVQEGRGDGFPFSTAFVIALIERIARLEERQG